jgi:hypothetical protein
VPHEHLENLVAHARREAEPHAVLVRVPAHLCVPDHDGSGHRARGLVEHLGEPLLEAPDLLPVVAELEVRDPGALEVVGRGRSGDLDAELVLVHAERVEGLAARIDRGARPLEPRLHLGRGTLASERLNLVFERRVARLVVAVEPCLDGGDFRVDGPALALGGAEHLVHPRLPHLRRGLDGRVDGDPPCLLGLALRDLRAEALDRGRVVRGDRGVRLRHVRAGVVVLALLLLRDGFAHRVVHPPLVTAGARFRVMVHEDRLAELEALAQLVRALPRRRRLALRPVSGGVEPIDPRLAACGVVSSPDTRAFRLRGRGQRDGRRRASAEREAPDVP